MTNGPNVGVILYPGESIEDENLTSYFSSFFGILASMCESLVAIAGSSHIVSNKTVRIVEVPFHESGSRSLVSKILKYVLTQFRICLRLITICKSCNVMIFFDIAELYTMLIFITKFFLRKKVIVVHCGSASRSSKIAYGNKWLGLGAVIAYLVKLLEKMSFRFADGIAVESESIVKFHGLERYRRKISICRSYYIDTGAFNIERDIRVRRNLVGYIGRFGEDKGAVNFAKAIGKVDNFDNIEFLMVGGFEEELGEIEILLKSHNAGQKVTLIGHVPHHEIRSHLNELKLLVLPSYGEGLPKTILEAMACGTPVLATSVGGIPDVIKDGETGFILEDNSPECIARNILRVLEYPKLDEIIKKASNLVEEEYTYEPSLARWKEMFSRWSGFTSNG